MIGGSWVVKHAELQSQQVLQEMDMEVLIKQSWEESLYLTTQKSPQKCVTIKGFGHITGGRSKQMVIKKKLKNIFTFFKRHLVAKLCQVMAPMIQTLKIICMFEVKQ